MSGSYKCSCGATCTTEWCHKCGVRNTNKYNASRHNDTSNWSSNDFTTYAAMNNPSGWTSFGDSFCSTDSGSSDSGGCSGSD